ncbi:MAG: HigA family addiction module antitoxin [Butyrivibrio sp.]|nr:HigA family addiction module antitoxin [Butyrivibrio sp.]
MKELMPVTPGEILHEEFLVPLNISAYHLAAETHIPQSRISAIVNGTRRISADTAARFAAFFGTSPEFWLNMQDRYDLDMLQKSGKIVQIDGIRPYNDALEN